MYWTAFTEEEIQEKVKDALSQNVSYLRSKIMGVPGSYLDSSVFNLEAAADSPFLESMVENPNHIGCHTFGDSEGFFKGTHQIEKELISMCAEEIFKAEPNSYDGYVAPIDYEGNIQAMWVYRNFFQKEYKAKAEEIGVLFSQDSNVSVVKGADILEIQPIILNVETFTRAIQRQTFIDQLLKALSQGIKYFICIVNMGNLKFGKVDDIELFVEVLQEFQVPFKIHVDASFGGFIYPIANPDNPLNFTHPHISSISVDAYRILQAPFGTGIILIRKNLLHYVVTEEASYVSGKDYTLSGSRSGANAIAVWMLLKAYGSEGLKQKINHILYRTDLLCQELDKKNITYFRNPFLNIVAIHDKHITRRIEQLYGLTPNDKENPQWWRVVVMEHVREHLIDEFIEY